jgi:tetratricopeptide (TPR) repeat protein
MRPDTRVSQSARGFFEMSTPSVPHFERQFGERLSQRDWPGATETAAACRAAWPREPSGWVLGSVVALLTDNRAGALALVEKYLASSPRNVQCLVQKTECLLALGERAAALAAAREAADAAGEQPAALDAIGHVLVSANAHQEALGLYHRAVASAPRDPELRAKRGSVHRFLGNLERAAEDFAAVLEMAPLAPEALKELVELRPQTREVNHLSALQRALAAAAPDSPQAASLHFSLAKTHEDLGDFAASWRHLVAGNRLERQRLQYDRAADRQVIGELIEAFPGPEPQGADTSGASPIFIVGLPRSGTTLVEQILGSHSAVQSCGELTALPEALARVVERSTPRPAANWHAFVAQLATADAPSIAREYLERVRARRDNRPRFTDKQTTNFFYCPLMLRAFPHGRIVRVTRHPLASCYALYKTRFLGAFGFAYDLDELADFYIGYHRLMTHWQRILPNRIFAVAYEDLVAEQEATTRALLDYVGLPFEAACLEFHHNPAAIMTASSVQVRQPLYDSSVDQWRHFNAELRPLAARLQAAGIAVD